MEVEQQQQPQQALKTPAKSTTKKTKSGTRTEIQGDETVEAYMMRVCEEQANELRKYGEAKIQEFIDEAAKAKAGK